MGDLENFERRELGSGADLDKQVPQSGMSSADLQVSEADDSKPREACRREDDLTEQFHDRFVLSERGGIQFGAGLGAVAGNENVTVTLLDTEHAAQIRAKFANASKIYQKVGSTIRIHADGKVEAV